MSPPYTTKQWVVASKPAGVPVLSGHDATFKLQTAELPPLKDGQVLAKVRYFSNDTGLRNFISSTVAPERLYVPSIPLGSPMRSGVIAEVIESASASYGPGSLVMDFHLGAWSELVVLEAATCQPLAPLPNGLPVTHHLGAFGASGLAAYAGLRFAGGARPGHTVVVSAAAGATGSMAVQIAARLLGAGRVVGVAGSDDKCAWVRRLGAAACVNYRSPSFRRDLAAATPGGVDVYFDNVGGAVLDAVIPRMNRFGTIAVCGAVASYNAQEEPVGLRNWFELVSMRLTVRGFIMLDYMDKAPDILQELIAAAADGRIQLDEGQTVVEARIEEQPEIWMRLFSGQNQGKLLTKLLVD